MTLELEVLAGRRAFPMAQSLLAGAPVGEHRSLTVGWYDSAAHPETGAFGCVVAGAGQDDLIGEVVQVTAGGRSAFVYVLQALSIAGPAQMKLARRAFAQIARLSLGELAADVVVVDS